MDLELNSEQRMIQKNVRRFMTQEIEPVADVIDREDHFPEGIWKKFGELGILGCVVGEEYGGSGLDLLSASLIMEQIARVCPALAISYGGQAVLCAGSIFRNGSVEQKKKYLPPLCSGEKVGGIAITEPESGSDAMSLRTKAVRDGDNFRLSGTKMFITNGAEGEIFLVYAKTDVDKGAKGISAFIVEREFPGFSVSRRLEKMGSRGSSTCELAFEDCLVPADNLMGNENEGIKIVMSGLDTERAFYSALPLGAAQGAFELALRYSLEREQFGKAISQFQLIKAKLADMYTRIEAARFLVYRAALLANSMSRGGRGTEVHKVAAAAILFAAEMSTWVANQAVQIHGGYGYMLEYPVNRFYRDSKLLEIGAGTSEIRRLIIADELISKGLDYP